jgi:hypothetical protein
MRIASWGCGPREPAGTIPRDGRTSAPSSVSDASRTRLDVLERLVRSPA